MNSSKPAVLSEVYIAARVIDDRGNMVTVLGLKHGTEPAFVRFKSGSTPPYADWNLCQSIIGTKAARKLNPEQEHEVIDWLRNGPVETLPGMAG